MKVAIDSHGVTNVGKKRERNEDQFLIAELNGSMQVHQTSVAIQDCSTIFGESQGHLLLVADGVGGHAAGDRASALVISAVAAYALNGLQWLTHSEDSEDISEQLQKIAQSCQKRLIISAREHPGEKGMATTLTLAIVIWPKLYVMHIGDSRCYLLRDGVLEQLTRDHTLGQLYSEFANELRDEKVATAQGANHVLWNVVSSEREACPVADITVHDLVADDQIILCTDGLTNHLADEEIAKAAASIPSTQDACNRLVDEANARGGKDNITVVLSRFSPSQGKSDVPMVETRVSLDKIIATPSKTKDLTDTVEFSPDK